MRDAGSEMRDAMRDAGRDSGCGIDDSVPSARSPPAFADEFLLQLPPATRDFGRTDNVLSPFRPVRLGDDDRERVRRIRRANFALQELLLFLEEIEHGRLPLPRAMAVPGAGSRAA